MLRIEVERLECDAQVIQKSKSLEFHELHFANPLNVSTADRPVSASELLSNVSIPLTWDSLHSLSPSKS